MRTHARDADPRQSDRAGRRLAAAALRCAPARPARPCTATRARTPGAPPGAGRPRCWCRSSQRPEELRVLFTRRTAHLRDHPGQISFPGGRAEPRRPFARGHRAARGRGGDRPRPAARRGAGHALRVPHAHRFPHHAGGGPGGAAVRAAPGRARGGRGVRGAARRSCSTRPTTSATRASCRARSVRYFAIP